MTSRIALITFMSAALAGGLMAKQQRPMESQQGARANRMERMAAALNLTDQQKQEARTIFMSERQAMRPTRQELLRERKAVESAIETGKPAAEIQQLASKEGPALGRLAASRAVTSAKFHAMLTPAQQQKLASLHQQWRERRAGATSETR
jgi:Spy/CpxP family protein refolding chaperone